MSVYINHYLLPKKSSCSGGGGLRVALIYGHSDKYLEGTLNLNLFYKIIVVGVV